MPIGVLLKQIRDEAIANKGAYIPYSQCVEPTKTLIKMLPYTENGICKALSAKWIAEHANDRSLWTWLCTPGTTNVKQGAIANLMVNFTEGVQRTGPLSNPTMKKKDGGVKDTGDLTYQTFVTDKYLGLYNLKRRGIVSTGISGKNLDRINFGYGIKTGQQLAVRLQEKYLNSSGGSYVAIGVLGRGGHAMAAFVGQDIAFFDPNFGEFYFENQSDFRKWFAKFWRMSGYINSFNSFYLLPYGLRA